MSGSGDIKPESPIISSSLNTPPQNNPRQRESTRQIFINVLDQANIPIDFFNDVLSKKRIFGFRTAMALSEDQHENIKAFVDKSEDEAMQ